jgi:hypothetical protein
MGRGGREPLRHALRDLLAQQQQDCRTDGRIAESARRDGACAKSGLSKPPLI